MTRRWLRCCRAFRVEFYSNSSEWSGTCGENTRWVFSNGILTISGTGEIENHTWSDIADYIHKVVIEEGVTNISECLNLHFLTEISIPSTVTAITENDPFFDCFNLKKINLPDSMTYIRGGMFAQLPIETIQLPKQLASISPRLFEQCTSLSEVILPKNLRSIGHMAFRFCESLTSLTFPEGITDLAFVSGIEDGGTCGAFSGSSIREIYLPVSIQSITGNPYHELSDIYYAGTISQARSVSLNMDTESSFMTTVWHCLELRY